MSRLGIFRSVPKPTVRISNPDDGSVWFGSNEVEAKWGARGDHRYLRILATQRRTRSNPLASFVTLSLRVSGGEPATADGRLQHRGAILAYDGPVRATETGLAVTDDSVDGALEALAYEHDHDGDRRTALAVELVAIRPETDAKFVANLETIVRATPEKFPDILHWFGLAHHAPSHRRRW